MPPNKYYDKYIKYKQKYITLKRQQGGYKVNFDNIFAGDNDLEYKEQWLKIWNELTFQDNKVIVHKPSVLFEDLKHRIPYKENQQVITANLHNGQLKLFLSEIQFLTKCMESYTKPQVVVYAGAAPNMRALFAMQYFPNIVWILVDPNPFKIMIHPRSHKYNQVELIKFIKSDELTPKLLDHLNKYNKGQLKKKTRIYCINELFTNDLADKLSAIKDTLFVCDIRTTFLQKGPSECDILWNLSQQWIWMIKMKSKFAYLKFRFPFGDMPKEDLVRCLTPDMEKHFELVKSLTGIDFLENYKNKKLVYVLGDIYLQLYAPLKSTESRVFVKREDLNKSKDYGTLKDYEDGFVYFNTVKRSYLIHENKYKDKKIGFDQCQDCSATVLVWDTYLKKYNLKDSDPLKEITKYLDYFGRPLLHKCHGKLFDKVTQEQVDCLTGQKQQY
jgi:hypothetical protein